MISYYNEIDPFAAQWLRNLISAGHLTPGLVDERDIRDVRPDDIAGFARAHFFSGIGGWDLALQQSGLYDDWRGWTGSCPCQPFSAAGQRKGFADERHLWPAWFDLIRQCRPPIVFGEQVEAAVRLGWLDAVFADLEAEDYACAATVLGAHSVGAPHIRQRLWFVAYADSRISEGCVGSSENTSERPLQGLRPAGLHGATGVLADAPRERSKPRSSEHREHREGGVVMARPEPRRDRCDHRGFGWSDAEWLPCRDGKARPVEPGAFPLAHGIPGRVGRLRAYGNAIVPEVAAAFIQAALACQPVQRGRVQLTAEDIFA